MHSDIWLKNIFYSHYNHLCKVAYRYVRNGDVCEDIVQECFIKLWEKHLNIDEQKYLAYLSVAVKNSCINYLRKNIETVSLESAEVQQKTSEGSKKPNAYQTVQIINNAMASLPEKCRLIFTMSRFENKSYKEIAEQLGISVKTVENQMGKAIKIMRDYAKKNKYFVLILWLFLN